MKSFCSIVQSDYPADGRIKKQCEALISLGYCVSVICLRHGDEKAYEEIDGVKVYRVNLQKNRGSKLNYLFEYFAFFILAFIQLNRLCLKKNFDIIQVSNLPDFLVFCTLVQKIRGAKIILDMHEIMPEFFVSKYQKKESSLIVKIIKAIEKLSLKYADQVITITEMARRLFNQRSIPGKNIAVIMNTVDDSIINSTSIKRQESFNLVYHGYLDKMYGIDIALAALKEFAKTNDHFKFYIFGNGPHKKHLEMLIRQYGLNQHVFMMGSVPHREMIDYLKNMDIGLLPIRKDAFTDLSFSNKLGEYIYLKIPVISSNLNSTVYYFTENEITYFTSNDPMSLMAQIAYAYNNPHVMTQKAAKAFEAYKYIGWTVMRKQYLDLVSSLIQQG